MCQALNKNKSLEGGNDEGNSFQSLSVPFSGARTALGRKTWSKALGSGASSCRELWEKGALGVGRFAMKQRGCGSTELLLSLGHCIPEIPAPGCSFTGIIYG